MFDCVFEVLPSIKCGCVSLPPASATSRFNFAQLLADNVRSVRMRADVCPVRGNIKIRFKKEKKGGIDVARLLKDVS